jgi:hypothetical protein
MGEADVMALGSIVNESEAAQMSMAVRLSLATLVHVDCVSEFFAFSTHAHVTVWCGTGESRRRLFRGQVWKPAEDFPEKC